MPTMAWMLVKRYDLHKLFTKLGGVGGSFVASHFVWLTTTPDYGKFWAKIYMTAPTITDVGAFQKMVAAYFSIGWLLLDHFFWRVDITSKTPAVNPPEEKK